MGKNSSIEWTHHTFNPWWGCKRVSPACENCYAEVWAHRLGHDLWGPREDRRFFGQQDVRIWLQLLRSTNRYQPISKSENLKIRFRIKAGVPDEELEELCKLVGTRLTHERCTG